MNSRDFVYWLQGFFEIKAAGDGERSEAALKGASAISAEQAACIRNHLNMVFRHEIDPSHGDATHQAELSALHQGVPVQPGQSVDVVSLVKAAFEREAAAMATDKLTLPELISAMAKEIASGAAGTAPKPPPFPHGRSSTVFAC